MHRRLLTAAVGLLVLAADRGANAQSSDDDALYRAAREAFDAGSFDVACPRFAEYQSRVPLPGALFALAECEARWPKPVAAVTHFEQFLAQTADQPATPVLTERRRIAHDELARLGDSVARILLTAPPRTSIASVTIDDATHLTLPAARPLVIAPGEHALAWTANGKTERTTIRVLAGETRRVELVAAEAAPAAALKPAPDAETPPSRPIPALAYVAGGIGVAGLAVGGITGGLALGAKSDIDAHCNGEDCDATGKRAADRSQSYATVSTVGFAVGVVALGAAVVLVLTRPTLPAKTSRALDLWRGSF